MDDIIKQLNDFPYEQLEQLEDKIKNIKEIKNYFNTIKNEYWKQYLPENTADIIENKVKVVSITYNDETIELSDETYNNCYDDGFWTVNIQLEIIGINGLVGLKYFHHSYKKHDRDNFYISLDNNLYGRNCQYRFSKCKYCKDNTDDDEKTVSNYIFILKKLHNALEIPYADTDKMLFLLFLPYGDFRYITDCFKSLELLLKM